MLKAGFARLDITPPLGTPLAGYFHARFVKDVWDPIELNALALRDESKTLLIVGFDAMSADVRALLHVREGISARTGVPVSDIMIQPLHQHTSIKLGDVDLDGNCVTDPVYLNVLSRKFGDVCQMALDDLADARLGVAAEPCAEPISFIRRFRMKDGSIGDSCFREMEEYDSFLGKADNNVYLLRFMREEKKDIALVNFCTHPDVIAKECITADWPGFVRRMTEARNPNTHCMTLTGFQGDSNHINVFLPKAERGKGYKHAEKMGRIIADAVERAFERVTLQEDTVLRAESRDVFVKSNMDGIEYFDECCAFTKRYRAGHTEQERTPSGIIYYKASFISTLPERPAIYRIPVVLIAIGKVAMIGFPGEPFTAYLHAMRAQAPDKFVVSLMQANGGMGYFPDRKAFAEGGYEVVTSPFTEELEEKLLATTKELLNDF